MALVIMGGGFWGPLTRSAVSSLLDDLSEPSPPALPDLEVSSFSVDGDGRFTPGERGQVDITFRNSGTGDAGRFDYKVYLSRDSIITSSDTEVGSGSVSFGLDAGRTDSENNVGFNIPSNRSAGTYYLGVIADTGGAVRESDEGNNTSNARMITIAPALADLEVSSFSVNGDGRFTPGESGTVDITFRNSGTGDAGRFDYRVYLSTNSTITSSDTPVGSGSVSFGLDAGRTDSENNVGFNIPSDRSAGTYYLGVIADTGRVVSESDEGNNTSIGTDDNDCSRLSRP